jgi:hypothetical protein
VLLAAAAAWAAGEPKPKSIFDFGLEPVGSGEVDQPDEQEEGVRAGSAQKPLTEESTATPSEAVSKEREKAADEKTASASEKELLKSTHVDAEGVITVDRTITFNLKETNGKDFVFTGELYPAAEGGTGRINIQLRRKDAFHGYSVDIQRMFVKRALLGGQLVKQFATPGTFKEIEKEKWHTFRIEVATTTGIVAQIDSQKVVAAGTIEPGGWSRVVVGPGAKLRKLKLVIEPEKGK